MKALYGLFIADDDEVIRESLKTRFDWPGMGYEVRGLFEDGSDVIACIQALIERGAPLPSVLLTDVVMYDKTGLDAAEYILRNRLPIAVVLLSGYQEFEFAVRGIQCRIYDYLLKPVDPSQLRALFERLAADLDGGVLFPPAEIPAAEPLSDEAEKIRRIRRYIDEHLGDDLSISRIAGSVYLSARQLQRLFMQQTGTPIGRYIHEERMKKAALLLQAGASPERAAEATGFSDVKYFRQVFAKNRGLSVSSYVKGRGRG